MSLPRISDQVPQEPSFPTQGRLLGIDFGTRRVGLAVSNPEQTMAGALEIILRSNPETESRRLRQIVQEYRIAGLVVGLPVYFSGDEGGSANLARQFGAWAAAETGLPVCFHDERYTSAIAEQFLMDAKLTKKKRKERLDKLVAQILLQSFLESDRDAGAPGALNA